MERRREGGRASKRQSPERYKKDRGAKRKKKRGKKI